MRRVGRLIGSALMMVAVLAVGSPDLEAQADPNCGEIVYGCNSGWDNAHNMNQNEEDENQKGEVGFHGTCDLCVSGGTELDPEVCHPTCELTEEEQEDLALALNQMTDAFLTGDIVRLAMAARLVPHRTNIHPDRRALQVRGCDDQILASYPLGSSLEIVTAALNDDHHWILSLAPRKAVPTSRAPW